MTQIIKPDPSRGTASPPSGLTYEEFLAWLDDETWAEWVDGEVLVMSPIAGEHQELGIFLLTLLRHFVEYSQLGVIRYEPFQ